MVPIQNMEHSKSRVDKNARFVRDFSNDFRERGVAAFKEVDEPKLFGAMNIVDDFRACHAKPLARVNAGLRYYVKKAGMAEPEVTQRLKRFSTIIDKLRREPTMKLTRMEDIGGVRVVLGSQAQANAVRDMLVKARKWNIKRLRTYVEGGDPGPKSDGYRAIHIVVEKDGFHIEIQLRTLWQDAWAQSVEQDTRRLRENLKFGAGPDDLREYYRMVSEYFAMREQDFEIDEEFMVQLANLYADTRAYFPDQGTTSHE